MIRPEASSVVLFIRLKGFDSAMSAFSHVSGFVPGIRVHY